MRLNDSGWVWQGIYEAFKTNKSAHLYHVFHLLTRNATAVIFQLLAVLWGMLVLITSWRHRSSVTDPAEIISKSRISHFILCFWFYLPSVAWVCGGVGGGGQIWFPSMTITDHHQSYRYVRTHTHPCAHTHTVTHTHTKTHYTAHAHTHKTLHFTHTNTYTNKCMHVHTWQHVLNSVLLWLYTSNCFCFQRCSGCSGSEALLLSENVAGSCRPHWETSELCTTGKVKPTWGLFALWNTALWPGISQRTVLIILALIVIHWTHLATFFSFFLFCWWCYNKCFSILMCWKTDWVFYFPSCSSRWCAVSSFAWW